MLDPNRVIAKAVKSCTYHFYVRCVKLKVRVGRITWPQRGAIHYHALLGLSDKGRAIKGLFFCYVILLGSMIYEMGL